MPKGYPNKAYSFASNTADKNRNNKKIKERLDYEALLGILKKQIKNFPDRRKGTNISKSLMDCALSAFSVFFTQSRSFLAYQKMMQTRKGKNNARSLFGIESIPSDNHIRYILDIVNPEYLHPVFYKTISLLHESKLINNYKSYKRNTLCVLDATGYFQSSRINCLNCSTRTYEGKGKKKKNEQGHLGASVSSIQKAKVHYHHSVMTPVLVHPALNHVISLPPEFIVPQDGSEKQDCEYNAGKRWFAKHGQFLSDVAEGGVTILGDDLYCRQSFCEIILSHQFDFILVCKPDSHKTLYEYLEFVRNDIQKVKIERWAGKRREVDTYRFYNRLPIRNGEKDVLDVNWCEIVTTAKKKPDQPEAEIYKNSFATNLEITEENVQRIVADGRARWKIENENYNVLKNRGYALEHNFGHGKQHLSALLLSFNLLAFLFHTVLDMTDSKYSAIRGKLGKRETFFNHIKVFINYYQYFKNWENLMNYMAIGMEIEEVDTS